MKKLLILLIALGFLSSCAVVKEYEKVNIGKFRAKPSTSFVVKSNINKSIKPLKQNNYDISDGRELIIIQQKNQRLILYSLKDLKNYDKRS